MARISYKVKEDFKEIIDREDIDLNKLKELPNYSTIPYHTSLTKIQYNLQTTLENLGYKVEKDSIFAKEGSFAQQIKQLDISFFGRKRHDIQGKIDERRSMKLFWIVFIGLVILSLGIIFKNIGVDFLSILVIGFGIFIFIKAPKIVTYTYTPIDLGIWILGDGHSIQGTKRQEIKEGSHDKSHGQRYIESTYVQVEANLRLGAKHDKINRYYTERILTDPDKLDVTLANLIKFSFQKKDKVSFQDESRYRKLPKNEEDVEKALSSDFKELKESLRKFVS